MIRKSGIDFKDSDGIFLMMILVAGDLSGDRYSGGGREKTLKRLVQKNI